VIPTICFLLLSVADSRLHFGRVIGGEGNAPSAHPLDQPLITITHFQRRINFDIEFNDLLQKKNEVRLHFKYI